MNYSSKFIETYADIFEGDILPLNDIVMDHIELIKKADSKLPMNNSFIIITNAQTQSYEFISKNFKAVTGLSRSNFFQNGVTYFLSRMHPDDCRIWLTLMEEIVNFCTYKVSIQNRTKLDIQYNFRFKTGNGKYINLLENQIPLYLDENGKPFVGLGYYTVFGEGDFKPIKATIRLLNNKNQYETIYSKNFSYSAILGKLSKRELEIARLLSQKKTSKEIADKLFNSNHTIDTHRRNILKKLNITSTIELVKFFNTSEFSENTQIEY